MAKHPHRAFSKKIDAIHRPASTDPRYELVFERRSSKRHWFANLVAELKSGGQGGRAAIGSAYALAARAVLNGIERLEDLNAERNFRQRAQAQRAASAAAPRLVPPSKSFLPLE